MSDPDMGARPKQTRFWFYYSLFMVIFWITTFVIYWTLNR